jgi:hypothetical protein
MQDNGIRSPIRQILMNPNTLKVKLDDLYSTRQKRLLKAVPKQKCRKSHEDMVKHNTRPCEPKGRREMEINPHFQNMRSYRRFKGMPDLIFIEIYKSLQK